MYDPRVRVVSFPRAQEALPLHSAGSALWQETKRLVVEYSESGCCTPTWRRLAWRGCDRATSDDSQLRDENIIVATRPCFGNVGR